MRSSEAPRAVDCDKGADDRRPTHKLDRPKRKLPYSEDAMFVGCKKEA